MDFGSCCRMQGRLVMQSERECSFLLRGWIARFPIPSAIHTLNRTVKDLWISPWIGRISRYMSVRLLVYENKLSFSLILFKTGRMGSYTFLDRKL